LKTSRILATSISATTPTSSSLTETSAALG
jgi:hypothetical protein